MMKMKTHYTPWRARCLQFLAPLFLLCAPMTGRAQGFPDLLWMKGLGAHPNFVATSDDGSVVLKMSSEPNVWVLRVSRGSDSMLLRTFVVNARSFQVALSPDGKCFLIADLPNKVQLRRVSDGAVLWSRTDASYAGASGFRFAPDSSTVAFVHQLGSQSAVSVNKIDGAQVGEFVGDDFQFSPDSSEIGIVSGRNMYFVRAAEGQYLRSWSMGPTGWPIAYSPNGAQLAMQIGNAGSDVRLNNALTGSVCAELTGYNTPWGYPFSSWVSEGLYRFRQDFSSNDTRGLDLFDFTQPYSRRVIDAGLSSGWYDVSGMAIPKDGSEIILAGESTSRWGRLHHYDRSTGEFLREDEGHGAPVTSSSFSADGLRVLSTSPADIRLWEAKTGKLIKTFPYAQEGRLIYDSALSPTGDTIAVCGNLPDGDSRTMLVSAADGSVIRRLEQPAGVFSTRAQFTPNGQYLLTADTDNTFRLWSVATGAQAASFYLGTRPAAAMAISPSGDVAALSGFGIYIVKLPSLEYLGGGGNSGGLLSMAFNPDGTRLVAGSSGTVRTYDVTNNNLSLLWEHTSTSNWQPVAVDTKGEYVAYGQREPTTGKANLAFWTLEDGSLARSYDDEVGYDRFTPTAISFSPDGSTYAYGRNDGTLVVARHPFSAPTNQPPIAIAGADQTFEATGPITTVTLDGSLSTDPEGDALTYSWSAGGSGLGEGPTLPVGLAPGGHEITLIVTDPSGAVSTDTVLITIEDTTAPDLTIPADMAVGATTSTGSTVVFSATATDLVDGDIPVTSSPASGDLFPLGTTTVTCRAIDAAGNEAVSTFKVTVTFSWSGVLQPVNADGSSIFKIGRPVPVKFRLTGASAGVTDAVARLLVAKVSNGVTGTEMEADSQGSATEGSLFRYDPLGGQYVFNLNTKTLTKGTYRLRIDLADGVVRAVDISLQ
jgi:WD40 repeat protein